MPLVALPQTTRTLRDFWLVASRRTTDAPIATVAHSADEAMEAVANGLGAVLISEGTVPIYQRPNITTIPVTDLDPSVLAIVWRVDDDRPIIRDITDIAASIRLDAPKR